MNKSLMRGVTYDEYHGKGKVQLNTKSADQTRGVPMGSYIMSDTIMVIDCQGVTKAGQACKARPVGGQMLCAGHLKQQEARDGSDSTDGRSSQAD